MSMDFQVQPSPSWHKWRVTYFLFKLNLLFLYQSLLRDFAIFIIHFIHANLHNNTNSRLLRNFNWFVDDGSGLRVDVCARKFLFEDLRSLLFLHGSFDAFVAVSKENPKHKFQIFTFFPREVLSELNYFHEKKSYHGSGPET